MLHHPNTGSLLLSHESDQNVWFFSPFFYFLRNKTKCDKLCPRANINEQIKERERMSIWYNERKRGNERKRMQNEEEKIERE